MDESNKNSGNRASLDYAGSEADNFNFSEENPPSENQYKSEDFEGASSDQVLRNLFDNISDPRVYSILFLEKETLQPTATHFHPVASFPSDQCLVLTRVYQMLRAREAQPVLISNQNDNSNSHTQEFSSPLAKSFTILEGEAPNDYQFLHIQTFGPNYHLGLFMLQIEKNALSLDDIEGILWECQKTFLSIIQTRPPKTPQLHLTVREQEVLTWVALGKSNAEIAEQMNISVHTINGYLKILYIKTNTTNRVSLSLYALKIGWL